MNINTCKQNDLYSLNPSRLALGLRNDPPSNYSSQVESQLLFNSQNLVDAQASNMYCPQSQMESESYMYHTKYQSLPLFINVEGKDLASTTQTQGKMTKPPVANYFEQHENFNRMSREHETREMLERIFLAINNMGQKINELQTELTSTRETEKKMELFSVVSLIKEQVQGLETAVTKQHEVQLKTNRNLQDHQKNWRKFQRCLQDRQAHLEAKLVELLDEYKNNAAAIQKTVEFQHGCFQTKRALSSEQPAQHTCQVECVNKEAKVDPEKVFPRAVQGQQSSEEKPTRPRTILNDLHISIEDSDDNISPQLQKNHSKSRTKQKMKRAHSMSGAKRKKEIHEHKFSMTNQLSYSEIKKINCAPHDNQKTYRVHTNVISTNPNSILSKASTSGGLNDNRLLHSDTDVTSNCSGGGLEDDLWDLSDTSIDSIYSTHTSKSCMF